MVFDTQVHEQLNISYFYGKKIANEMQLFTLPINYIHTFFNKGHQQKIACMIPFTFTITNSYFLIKSQDVRRKNYQKAATEIGP